MYSKRNLINYLKEYKFMDGTQYIPIIVFFILLIYSKRFVYPTPAFSILIPTLEFSVPMFSAWWCIFLLQNILEEPGGEVFFTYPIKRYKLGLLRILFSLTIYIILIALFILLLQNFSNTHIFTSLFIQLACESIFFCGLGFLSMVLTSNTGWAIFVVILYSSTQIITRGKVFSIVNIFQFNTSLLGIKDTLLHNLPALVVGCLLLAIGNYKFINYSNYKQ